MPGATTLAADRSGPTGPSTTMGPATGSDVIDISSFVETRKLNGYHLFVVSMCVLILWVDGTDFAAANVAAPLIVKALHTDRAAMGQVFGAGNFGILVGSLFFGFIGDLYGRKIGAITGVLAYSLPALAVAFATSVDQLTVLRFLAGLGIGGVVPNVISLLNETAPKPYRASFVILGFIGYAIGSFTSAQLVAQLAPTLGWQTPFVFAGVAGVTLATLLVFILPESVRYLVLRDPNSEKARAMVRRLGPDVELTPQTQLSITVPPAGKLSVAALFGGDRWLATPLLWICYFCESLTYMTLISWFTTLLTDAGIAQTEAASAYSYGAVVGIVTMLALTRLVDLFGMMTTVSTALAGIAGLLAMTLPLDPLTRVLVAVATYAACNVTHNSLNATVATFYPTNMRAKGVGWATGAGRVALTLGPLVIGYLLAAKLPSAQVLQLIAAPYVVVAVLCLVLGLMYRSRASAQSAG